jgi:predicted signal transduction protein with EAL and GGDEF domain
MMNQVTELLLARALEEAKKWPSNTFISFNLSTQDISTSEAALRMIAIVNKSGFDANRITFEITETAVMRDYESAVNSLKLLKNLGSKIALDDFGTGYSSLSYIHALPLDKLKLDRSFIINVETDNTARSIVQSVVGLCANLDLDCIVEGVETEGQLDAITEMGCSIIQGYFFSRPLEAAGVVKYLKAEQQIEHTA